MPADAQVKKGQSRVNYEVIRGIMLADETVAERSRETGLDREIARIVGRKYGYKTNHHTVRGFLARHPIPVQLPLPVTGFHQLDDAYRARWTVVKMHYEGWQSQSIATCLGLSRKHVWPSYERREPPRDNGARQLTLPLVGLFIALIAWGRG